MQHGLAATRRERLEAALSRLALAPPQTLLLEGGTEKERLAMAMFWAMTANCPEAVAKRASGQAAAPCRECSTCRQIEANENLDLLIFDGRIPNRQDEESPGPIRALRMENMRELKSLSATAPHGQGKRVAIFQGMSQTREEALNSLLKTLEDPAPHTMFVLLAPQRQQLLPTLVSRSFCLTLPWRGSLETDADLADWESALAGFLEAGSGLMERVGAKGAVDASLGARILMLCQRALVRALCANDRGSLARALEPVARSAGKMALVSRWLAEAQEMLAAQVAPARVLEAFWSRLFVLLHQKLPSIGQERKQAVREDEYGQFNERR